MDSKRSRLMSWVIPIIHHQHVVHHLRVLGIVNDGVVVRVGGRHMAEIWELLGGWKMRPGLIVLVVLLFDVGLFGGQGLLVVFLLSLVSFFSFLGRHLTYYFIFGLNMFFLINSYEMAMKSFNLQNMIIILLAGRWCPYDSYIWRGNLISYCLTD